MSVVKSRGMAAFDAKSPLKPWDYEIRALRPKDVKINVRYCGVCHSDLHAVRAEIPGYPPEYPFVAGHEIVGVVEEVGKDVKNHKVGEWVGVGCFVNSCRNCECCKAGNEPDCLGSIMTYGSKEPQDGKATRGGYGKYVLVDEHFTLKIPAAFANDPEKIKCVPPLFCAGITTYNAIVGEGANKPGKKVGIIGLGGLGHMAVKLCVAFGVECVVFSSSDAKKDEALKVLKATHFVNSKKPEEMAKFMMQLDVVLDTASKCDDANVYMNMLKIGGTFCCVGLGGTKITVDLLPVIRFRRGIRGWVVGGMEKTKEMLEFCAKHDVLPMCEIIKPEQINEGFERILKSQVHYRLVMDMTQKF